MVLYLQTFILCSIIAIAAASADKYVETCNITSSVFQSSAVLQEVEQLLKQEILRQRHLGESQQYAAKSCEELREIRPCLNQTSYWIETENGVEVVSCNNARQWKNIVHINMQTDTQCPPGLEVVVNSSKRMCRSPVFAGGCSSINFSVRDTYNRVRGRVIGYQYHSTCAFGPGGSIDGAYVDGVSITHGSNPRNHIWTFAVGYDELKTGSTNAHCPCVQPAALSAVPTFVGTDYYCDTGSHAMWTDHLYIENPVWDGQGCGPSSTCCDNPNLPWFTKELQQPTTDDIELRICRSSDRNNEDVLLEIIELYIQMTEQKIASVNMQVDTQCPDGLELLVESGKRLCRRPGGTTAGHGCNSVIFSVNGRQYSKVRGKVIGYQYGIIDALNPTDPLDSNTTAPVDGISITYGQNPRNHIWTYAVGRSEEGSSSNSQCPCTHPSAASQVPSYIGNDYYCDTGSRSPPTRQLYLENPLWDGQGCGPTSTCCDDPDLPWFTKDLGKMTNSDIEFRVCQDGIDEYVAIEIIDIYVE